MSTANGVRSLLPRRRAERVPCVPADIRVYTYELSPPYRPRGNPAKDLGEFTQPLRLPSRTFYAVREFFRTCVGTVRPDEADYFFVPINLMLFQFRNEDPKEVLSELPHLTARRDHLLVAAGDFSNRSRRNHYGEAYRQIYEWLEPFVLLAHESTSDLIPGQDVGVIPYHALADGPEPNANQRPLLYSFLGELEHVFLPPDHVRTRMARLEIDADDVLIARSLDSGRRKALRANYKTADDYELVSRNSVFTLAPAGYGRWTYRFFQAIAWGSIPVLLSDDYLKPFASAIPYDEFTLTIPERDLERIDSILRGVPAAEIDRYQRNLATFQREFTKRSFFRHLVRELEMLTG